MRDFFIFLSTLLLYFKIDLYNHLFTIFKPNNYTANMSAITLESAMKRVEELEKKMEMVLSKLEIETDTKKDNKKDTKEKKAKKTKKDDSDDEKPKTKRVSGYILYSNANRTEVKEKLAEDSDEKPKNTEVMKELARMWKELSDDEKEVWNDKAKQAKQEATEVA